MLGLLGMTQRTLEAPNQNVDAFPIHPSNNIANLNNTFTREIVRNGFHGSNEAAVAVYMCGGDAVPVGSGR
ncbi:hypothetical protein FRB95_002061 [Tulasnella sp. JGI-2019a]|nr:hypothetical protein FRB95_002061 [Tulasnella sp. JGI-2019a]